MPSADLNESGTFMITNNFLNKHNTCSTGAYGWNYHTFAYGIGITFFSRLEVGYVCVLFNGDWNPDAVDYRQRIMKNQDRHFVGKVLLLKEGEVWNWTPSIAIGVSDPVTGSGGDYKDGNIREAGNGYFNRYYAVASKHFQTTVGEIGAHFGYQFNVRKDPHYNAPCVGITWRPVWIENKWFSPRFIVEYDARTPNVGFIADIWDSRFEAMFELQNFQWVSFGLRFKLKLMGAE